MSIKLEYIDITNFLFEMNLGEALEEQVGSFLEKNRGQKSHSGALLMTFRELSCEIVSPRTVRSH
jgi:hypothetical protein